MTGPKRGRSNYRAWLRVKVDLWLTSHRRGGRLRFGPPGAPRGVPSSNDAPMRGGG